jgi:hypothetical protein
MQAPLSIESSCNLCDMTAAYAGVARCAILGALGTISDQSILSAVPELWDLCSPYFI